jgi:hypothetical protein
MTKNLAKTEHELKTTLRKLAGLTPKQLGNSWLVNELDSGDPRAASGSERRDTTDVHSGPDLANTESETQHAVDGRGDSVSRVA